MGLAPKMGRDKAHDVLYAIIHDPAMGDKSLAEMLLERADVKAHLGEAEIRRLTDPARYLGLSEVMVDRVSRSRGYRRFYLVAFRPAEDRPVVERLCLCAQLPARAVEHSGGARE